MEYIKPVLDLEEMDDNGETTFYSYNFNNWKMWFSQYPSGHIYSVSVAKRGDQHVGVSVTSNRIGAWYPNKFLVCANHESKTTDAMRNYINELEEAIHVMDSIEHFLYNSKHYELFCRQSVVSAMEAMRLGDYDLEGVEITDDDIDTLTRRIYNMRDPAFVDALIRERNHDVLMPIVSECLREKLTNVMYVWRTTARASNLGGYSYWSSDMTVLMDPATNGPMTYEAFQQYLNSQEDGNG